MVADRTKSEKVEVLVGEVIHEEVHGKRVRFEGREVDRYDTHEARHVLSECGLGRYRILVSRFDGSSEIHPDWRHVRRGRGPHLALEWRR